MATDRSFGDRFWFGVVTSVDDPDKEGRLQVRIHNFHDDKTNIPDKDLPWSKHMHHNHSAGHNKIGKTPVGHVVGTTLFGVFLDKDKQYPLHIGAISKAGDPQTGFTTNGMEQLIEGTNSTPPAGRTGNNAIQTQKTSDDIKQQDSQKSGQEGYGPTEKNDSDAIDPTIIARQKTQFANNPTVASSSPSGSILSQIQTVDPSNLNAVLQNAVGSFIKMQTLSSISSVNGPINILGGALGSVFSSIAGTLGSSTLINALGALIATGTPSPITSQAVYVGLTTMEQPIINPLIVPQPTLDLMIAELTTLLQSGLITLVEFEAFLLNYLNQIQSNASQNSLGSGVNSQNILNVLGAVLPTIAPAINSILGTHLPTSVLNNSVVSQALNNFAMSQAYLKAPTSGIKYLGIQATQSTPAQQNLAIAASIANIPGVIPTAVNVLSNLFH